MVKLMNLNHSSTVIPRTLVLLLLTGIEGYGTPPESGTFLDVVNLSHIFQMIQLQGPNLDKYGMRRTLALPKGRKPYGKRAAVVLCRKAKEGQQVDSRKKETLMIPKGCETLTYLRKNYKDGAVRSRLIHYIADVNTLILAYEIIKSRPRNMTPGPTPEKLDKIDVEHFSQTARKLRAGKYRFTPARVWIPKPGKSEKRPLQVASATWREAIVQKAMELVISSIYEPDFLPTSHARPNKSTHTALKMADVQLKGSVWFIEADISKCFHSIQHERLIKCLSKRIGCQKTLALIKSGLKAGYIEIGGIAVKASKGTPQGSALSPLLCNVFLHELDVYMAEICREYSKEIRRHHPRYTAVLNKIATQTKIEEKLELKPELRRYPISFPMDDNFSRVRYIRYADNFIISVTGPHSLALKIKELVSIFLEKELGLHTNQSKTLLTKAWEGPAILGTEITWRASKQKKVVLSPPTNNNIKININIKFGGKSKGRKTRTTGRLSLHAPMEKLSRKLVERKFAKWDLSGKTLIPIGLGRLQNMSHSDIIFYYNAVIRRILNYYSFADNRSSLGSVVRILHMSCARTLALKYKQRYMSKTYKKFGSSLECPETKVKIYKPTTLKRAGSTCPKNLEMSWTNKLTRSNLAPL
jgi:retron-type reverse transcriptase